MLKAYDPVRTAAARLPGCEQRVEHALSELEYWQRKEHCGIIRADDPRIADADKVFRIERQAMIEARIDYDKVVKVEGEAHIPMVDELATAQARIDMPDVVEKRDVLRTELSALAADIGPHGRMRDEARHARVAAEVGQCTQKIHANYRTHRSHGMMWHSAAMDDDIAEDDGMEWCYHHEFWHEFWRREVEQSAAGEQAPQKGEAAEAARDEQRLEPERVQRGDKAAKAGIRVPWFRVNA